MHPKQYRLPFNHAFFKGATVKTVGYNSYEQANSIKKCLLHRKADNA